MSTKILLIVRIVKYTDNLVVTRDNKKIGSHFRLEQTKKIKKNRQGRSKDELVVIFK